MKKILPFICFFLISNLVFGQMKAERTKYFQEKQQEFIDTQNPVFAKIETLSDGKIEIETILKTDIERIKIFKENANKYLVQRVNDIPIRATLIKWEERKNVDKNCSSSPEDCIVWQLIEFPVDVIEKVKTYRLKPIYFIENELFKKHYQDIRQKAINSTQPIYAKIQLENGKEEVILKTDSVRIKEITTLSEKYILEKQETININTTAAQWIKRKPERPTCCLTANPDDCLVWCLVEVPVYATETIKFYKLKLKQKKAIVKDKYLFGTPEHEAYKAVERQKRIDNAQPIYAKIQIQTDKGLEEKVILKTDSTLIQKLKIHSEDYILHDIEIVTFEIIGFEYWQKKTGRDANCCYAPYDDCLAWCLVEYPKFTATETIEIFRKIAVKKTTENKAKVTLNTDISQSQIEHKIYPNPFNDYITVTSTTMINNIIIFDEVGRRILEKQIQNTEKRIDLTHLKVGIYFVQIITENDKKTLKIIKK